MNTIKSFLLLFSFISASLLFNPIPLDTQEDIKWGKLPDAHREINSLPKYPDAPAVVLGDEMEITYDFVDEEGAFKYNRHKRIKILKEEGLRYKAVRIRYHEYDNLEKLTDVDAQTIKPDGSVISLKKRDFEVVRSGKFYSEMVFTLPEVEVGDVVEYRYQVTSKIDDYLRQWHFQTEIPTLYSDFFLEFPVDFYQYDMLRQGTLNFSQNNSEQYWKTFSIREEVEEYGLIDGGTFWDPTRGVNREQSTFEIKMLGISLRMENTPPLIPEKHATTIRDHTSAIGFYKNFVFENDIIDSKIIWWWDISQDLASRDNFGSLYLRKRYAKDILKKARKSTKSSGRINAERAIERSYDLVQSLFTWNGDLDWYPRRSIPEALDEGSANSALINLALVSLLRYYELDAWPALISTRDHGKTLPKYPFTDQFNYLVAYVNYNGREILLDAVHPELSPGLLHPPALNNRAWVVHNTEPRWLDLQPETAREEIHLSTTIAEDGSIQCAFRVSWRDYAAVLVKKDLQTRAPRNFFPQRIRESVGYSNLQISNSEMEDQSPEVVLEGSFTVEPTGTTAGDTLYIDGIPLIGHPEELFLSRDRHLPVDLAYGWDADIHTSIQWPADWKVVSIPESVEYRTENSESIYSSNTEKHTGSLQRRIQYTVKDAEMPVSLYGALYDLHELIRADMAHAIGFVRN